MHTPRDAIRCELAQILRETGVAPSRLARIAGIQHSTITRFLKNENAPILSSSTMFKLRQARDKIVAMKSLKIDPESLSDEEQQRAIIAALRMLPADRRREILNLIFAKIA